MTIDGFCSNKIVWWGRSDLSYSRNGVIRSAMRALGYQVSDFKPKFTFTGHIEATFSSSCNTDCVWVPCFRQRDVVSASKWAKKKNIPLIFDPLISAYDKQVFERNKFLPSSASAMRLLGWESNLFKLADVLVADTHLHAQYFEEIFGVNPKNIYVVPVGAEEHLFHQTSNEERNNASEYEVLFYGNFLELHGVDTICDAILKNKNASIKWTLVGDGPMKAIAINKCGAIPNVTFLGWKDCAYEQLPTFIQRANLVLGIFGSGDKAKRVIPNKVYQAIACGRPVVTMRSDAYPAEILTSSSKGIHWVEPNNADEILRAIEVAITRNQDEECEAAYSTYAQYFSKAKVKEALQEVFQHVYCLGENK